MVTETPSMQMWAVFVGHDGDEDMFPVYVAVGLKDETVRVMTREGLVGLAELKKHGHYAIIWKQSDKAAMLKRLRKLVCKLPKIAPKASNPDGEPEPKTQKAPSPIETFSEMFPDLPPAIQLGGNAIDF